MLIEYSIVACVYAEHATPFTTIITTKITTSRRFNFNLCVSFDLNIFSCCFIFLNYCSLINLKYTIFFSSSFLFFIFYSSYRFYNFSLDPWMGVLFCFVLFFDFNSCSVLCSGAFDFYNFLFIYYFIRTFLFVIIQ